MRGPSQLQHCACEKTLLSSKRSQETREKVRHFTQRSCSNEFCADHRNLLGGLICQGLLKTFSRFDLISRPDHLSVSLLRRGPFHDLTTTWKHVHPVSTSVCPPTAVHRSGQRFRPFLEPQLTSIPFQLHHATPLCDAFPYHGSTTNDHKRQCPGLCELLRDIKLIVG